MPPETKYGSAVLAGALALAMAGCLLRSKQAANAVPAPPLSTPQTQVVLPVPQPLNPYALATADSLAQPAEPPPAQPEVSQPVLPEIPSEVSIPPPRKTPRTPPKQPARKAPPETAQTAPPDAAPAPLVEQRPAVQAIVSAGEQKELKDSAQARKREVRAVLARIKAQRMSASDQDLVKRIEFFVTQSDQSERNGDMSQADDFAQRAQALARGWQGAR